MAKKDKKIEIDIRKGGYNTYRDLQNANALKFAEEHPEYEESILKAIGSSTNDEPLLLTPKYFQSPLMQQGSYWGESKYDPESATLEEIYSEDGGLYADRINAQAEEQSTLEKWLHGAGKFLVYTGTTLLDSTAGLFAGLVNAGAYAMSGGDWDDVVYGFVNNPISKQLHDVQQWSEKVMPNYRTYEEQNRPWWENMGTANFWADNFLKNTGFFAGAYLSGVGTSRLLSNVSNVNNAKNIFKGSAVTALDNSYSSMQLTQAFKNGEAILNGEKLTNSLIDLGKSANRKALGIKLTSGIVGSIGESRMEALSGSEEDYNYRLGLLNEAKQKKLSNIEYEIPQEGWDIVLDRESGKSFRMLNEKGETYKQYLISKIENDYNKALNELADERKGYANSSFFLNLAITSLDNIYQFGEALTGGFKQTRQLASIKRLTDGTYKASKKGIVRDVAGALGSPVFEGTQEMLQRSIQVTGERWNASKFNEYYGQALDPKGLEAQANYFATLAGSTGDVFADPKEWENFVLGALTTMLIPLPGSSFVGGFKNAKANNAYSKGLADGLNAIQNDENKKEWLLHLNRLGNANEVQMQALEEDDAFTFKNAEMDKIISSAITYSQAGKFQDFLDLVESAYNIQPSDIETLKSITKDKQTGVSPYEKMTDEQIIELFSKNKKQAIENAKKIHNSYTALQESFGGNINPKYLNTLTYLTASVDNREGRIKAITEELIKEINNDIQAFEDAFGYSPVERLKDIQDLKTWFAAEDKKELFEWSLGHRTKDALNKASETSKKVDKKTKRLKTLRGQYTYYKGLVNKLEAKKASEGLTEDEEAKLKKAKRKVRNATSQMPEVRQTIEDLKSFISEEVNKSNLDQKASMEKLSDLSLLLAERELLIDSINQLQKTPTIFEDSLNRDLINAVNNYDKRIAVKDYNRIKNSENIKDAIIETLNNQKTSLNSLINIAEENNDEQMKKELKLIEDLISKDIIINEIFDPETTDLPINDTTAPYIELIKNTIKEAIYASNSLEETDGNIEKGLEDLSIIGKRSYNINQQTLDDLISQVFTELKNIKKTKEGVSKSKTKDDTENNIPKSDPKLDSLYKIKKRKNFEDFIRNKTEEELKELIINAGLEDEFIDDDNDITWDDYTKEELENKLIEIINKLPEQTVEETAEEDDDVTPPDSPASSEDEEVFPTKGKVASEQSKGGFSSRTEILPPSKLSGTVKDQIVGTNEEGSVDENKSDDINDAWHGNRNSAKYKIKKLQDGTLEIVSDDYQWYTKYLLANGINHQEFIDSGELQRLKEWHEERGEKLRVRFIIPGSVRAISKEGKAYNRPLNDTQDDSWWENFKQHYAGGFYSDTDLLTFKNIVQSQTIFLAVEKPKGYNASKDTFTTDVLSVDGHRKVQLIGVLDKTSQDLRDALKTDTEGLDAHLRMSSIATELEWVYSGRLVKENSTFEKGEHDLKDVLPEGSAEGVIQIEIVTQSDNLTIGENLPGTVVPLNTNREKIVISNKSDRYGTIWMKTREADGRVYYKGVKIKEFNSSYEETNTAVYKGIRGAVKALIQADTSETSKNALSLLRRYLYLGSGKTPLYKDVNSDTIIFNDTGETIDTSELNEETINNIIDALKRRSYTFSVGLNDLTLDEIIQSNILTTDLAQIHNANSSFIISKVVFDDKGDWWVNPSNDVETKIKKGIHTGKKGLQPARGFVNRVKTEDGQIYSQRDDGLWTVYENGEYVVVDDKLTANEKFKLQFLVDLQYGKLGSTKLYYHDANKKKIKVWQRQNPNKANTLEYLDERGHFLTPEEAKALKEFIRSEKGSKKKAAADAKLKAIHAEKENPIETTPVPNEEVNEESNDNIEDNTNETQEEEPVIKSDDNSIEPEIFKIGEEENVVKSTGSPVLDAVISRSVNDDTIVEYIDDNFETYNNFETSLINLFKENKVSEDALNKYLELLNDGETDSAIKLLDDIINCRN